MSLTGDLITHILSDSNITDKIGQRIFDLYVPDDTQYPYCSFVRDSMRIEDHISGLTALRRSEYVLDIFSTTSLEGEDVEEAFIQLLGAFRGVIGESDIQVIKYNGSEDTFLVPVDASEESVHQITINFEVHWKQTS